MDALTPEQGVMHSERTVVQVFVIFLDSKDRISSMQEKIIGSE